MTPADQARLLLRKAQQDEAILQQLLDNQLITDESLGFHAQQAAEKLLKALLTLHGLDYPRSHDLSVLLALLGQGGVVLPDGLQQIADLTPMATLYRYEDLPLDVELPRSQWPVWLAQLRTVVKLSIESSNPAPPCGSPEGDRSR
jgi:HEPN domain-containing protein